MEQGGSLHVSVLDAGKPGGTGRLFGSGSTRGCLWRIDPQAAGRVRGDPATAQAVVNRRRRFMEECG
ncbi:hypothetical protein TRIUR3_35247 [Triticum urartu]|uniref:Uncharacterized protein n=1 Tax=Triticum urartu TaxID=4572 RepID=M7ZDP2_TRIUA|nr:hypothetical protein TRIUR3_35247 [Triticum urartu]